VCVVCALYFSVLFLSSLSRNSSSSATTLEAPPFQLVIVICVPPFGPMAPRR
jgi:hypothetical protein